MAPGMIPVAASSAGSRTSIRIMFEGVEEGEREIFVFIYSIPIISQEVRRVMWWVSFLHRRSRFV